MTNQLNSERNGSKKAVRRIVEFFAPYWKAQSLVVTSILCVSLLGLIPAYMTARIIDVALPERSVRDLVIAVAAMVLAAAISAGLNVVQAYFTSIVSEGMMRDIRSKLICHLHKAPISFFAETTTGEVMNHVSSDVDSIDVVVINVLRQTVMDVFTLVTTLGAMFLWDWRLALISVAIVPAMVLPLRPMARRMYETAAQARQVRDRIQSISQETLSLSGVTLIKSFVRESLEELRFHRITTELMHAEIKLALVGQWFRSAIAATIILGPALLWLGGGWLALHNGVAVGTVVAFLTFVQFRLYGPVSNLLNLQAELIKAWAIFDRIFRYLDLQTENYGDPTAVKIARVSGVLRLENVDFAYGNQPVLCDISFHIEAGQMAAVVGPSGAGKSTLATLLTCFYSPNSGKITIDGVNIDKMDMESLRRAVGTVTQETFLMNDTVKVNLQYGKENARDDEIVAAARSANIHDVICRLPDGYDTVIGERGHRLSGGERQRLALARMLLKDPRILVLDEATSLLDSRNEAEIQTALEIAMRGRTTLVIAHRLSTITSADVIIVLEEGKVVECGRHKELLKRKGLYRTLFETQARGFNNGHEVSAEVGPISGGDG